MTDSNPYAAPSSDLADGAPIDLATRGSRFLAALIDSIILSALTIPLMFLTGYWTKAMAGEQTMMDTVFLAMVGLVAYLIFNGYLLAKYGQSIGKRLVKTRIVAVQDGQLVPLSRLVLLRLLPIQLLSQIPLVGPLVGIVDTLFIFRGDRRCVHDLIAGTKVVNV